MISAFARAGAVLGDPEYTEVAARAAAALLEHMRAPDLTRIYHRGRAHLPATLEDYAFVALALLDLFESTGDPQWLDTSLSLTEQMCQRFEDPEDGLYFSAEAGRADLLVRQADTYDGATPSANGVALEVLLGLFVWTGRPELRERVDRGLRALAGTMERHPGAMTVALRVLDTHTQGPIEVFLVRPAGARDTALLEVWRAHHVPRARMLRVAHEDLDALVERVPALQGRAPIEGHATAFVCREGACELPVTTPEAFAAQLLAL